MNILAFSPQSGGIRIPPAKQAELRGRLERHAAKQYAGRYTELIVRFRGALCYIDAYTGPKPLTLAAESEKVGLAQLREIPAHLGRLRYFGGDRWSYAFYTYSNERYEPCLFHSGEWFGTPEAALDIGAMYLDAE